jgi:hypothetical protein
MIEWSRIISAGLAPIIVISACGLLCLAFYNRLAAVVTRVRQFQRELLHEQEALAKLRRSSSNDEDAELVRHYEIVGMLRVQSEHVFRRAKLIQSCLFCLLLTILLLTGCSLALCASVVWPATMITAAVFFAGGLLSMVAGILFAMMELRHALDPITLEAAFVTELSRELADVKEERTL